MTAETKWTPGPWGVGTEDGMNGNTVFSRVKQESKHPHAEWQVCQVYGIYMNTPVDECKDNEGMANANLISAAPDLYSALEQATVSMLDSGYNPDSATVVECMRVMAAARGEQE